MTGTIAIKCKDCSFIKLVSKDITLCVKCKTLIYKDTLTLIGVLSARYIQILLANRGNFVKTDEIHIHVWDEKAKQLDDDAIPLNPHNNIQSMKTRLHKRFPALPIEVWHGFGQRLL